MATTTLTSRTHGYSQWAWFLQAVSGILLIFFLTLHMVAQHFIGQSGVLSYQEVVAYLRNPVIFVLETAFAASVLFHALAGVRAVILDLSPSPAQVRRVNIGLTALGIIMFLWAFGLTLSIVL